MQQGDAPSIAHTGHAEALHAGGVRLYDRKSAMTCPANPPPPDGYRVWRQPVPKPLADWAVYLLRNELPRTNYGTMWGMSYTPPNGASEDVIARRDHHTWSHDRQGNLVTGLCIPGITLYAPVPMAALASYNPATDTIDTPDPNAAVFNELPIDWPMVALTAGAATATVLLFWWAIKAAGPKHRRA